MNVKTKLPPFTFIKIAPEVRSLRGRYTDKVNFILL